MIEIDTIVTIQAVRTAEAKDGVVPTSFARTRERTTASLDA